MSDVASVSPGDLDALILDVHWAIENGPVAGHRSVARIEADGRGYCGDYARVLAARLIARGILCRIVTLSSDAVRDSHVWVEVLIDGAWSVLDPTFAVVIPDAQVRDLYGRVEWRSRLRELDGRYNAHPWWWRYYEPPFASSVSSMWVAHDADPGLATRLPFSLAPGLWEHLDRALPYLAARPTLLVHPALSPRRLLWPLWIARGRPHLVDAGLGSPRWLRSLPGAIHARLVERLPSAG